MSVAGSKATLKGNTHQRGAPKQGFTCILHLAGVDTRHKKRMNVTLKVHCASRMIKPFSVSPELKLVEKTDSIIRNFNNLTKLY